MEQAPRQSAFDRKHAASDPTVNMMMAMYMLDAMRRFDKMPSDQVKAVASEIAVVGTRGISTAKDAVYTLKTIPVPSSRKLLCLVGAGVSRTSREDWPSVRRRLRARDTDA